MQRQWIRELLEHKEKAVCTAMQTAKKHLLTSTIYNTFDVKSRVTQRGGTYERCC